MFFKNLLQSRFFIFVLIQANRKALQNLTGYLPWSRTGCELVGLIRSHNIVNKKKQTTDSHNQTGYG
jgi:hypothetical protein